MFVLCVFLKTSKATGVEEEKTMETSEAEDSDEVKASNNAKYSFIVSFMLCFLLFF